MKTNAYLTIDERLALADTLRPLTAAHDAATDALVEALEALRPLFAAVADTADAVIAADPDAAAMVYSNYWVVTAREAREWAGTEAYGAPERRVDRLDDLARRYGRKPR